MRRQLPSLNAIRAFEAVMRCGTTTDAAAELGVTHGAVSRQLQQLEAWLGRQLFKREKGRLCVTPAGQAYAQAATKALDILDTATDAVLAHRGKVVKVNTTSSFASEWLLPRLEEFHTNFKDIEVWIDESKAIVDVNTDICDLAIRMGEGSWPSVHAEPLMDDRLITVCTPSLARSLERPRDLLKTQLLHDDDPQASWARWLACLDDRFSQNEMKHFKRGSRYASSSLLLRAAAAGAGVAVARERLAQGMIDGGSLVQPFPQTVSIGDAYWLVTRRKAETSRSVRMFVQWLKSYGHPARLPG